MIISRWLRMLTGLTLINLLSDHDTIGTNIPVLLPPVFICRLVAVPASPSPSPLLCFLLEVRVVDRMFSSLGVRAQNLQVKKSPSLSPIPRVGGGWLSIIQLGTKILPEEHVCYHLTKDSVLALQFTFKRSLVTEV